MMLRGTIGSASLLALLAVAACTSSTGEETAPSSTEADVTTTVTAAKTVLAWNTRALDAATGEPTRSARDLAIVHLAIYDAVQSIAGTYVPYTGMAYDSHANMAAAIGQAAHDTLAALYPAQAQSFDAALTSELAANPAPSRDLGVARGKRAAANVLALRANDVATTVKPFTLISADQFRAPAPYAVGSAEWTRDLVDVAAKGGDGVTTPTERTADETSIATFWSGTSPRRYNQVTNVIADKRGYTGSPIEMSRLLAVVNTAMADAGIACAESKAFYALPRPAGAIRATAPVEGGNPTWTPLAATTDATPSYPSDQGCYAGALFEVLEKIVGDTSFTFASDELPRSPRSYPHLADAATEDARSGVLLGVQWQNDGTAGIALGHEVGDHLLDGYFGHRTIAGN